MEITLGHTYRWHATTGQYYYINLKKKTDINSPKKIIITETSCLCNLLYCTDSFTSVLCNQPPKRKCLISVNV